MPHELVDNLRWEAAPSARHRLAEVYRVHVRYVWRCLRHLGVRPADLEDVTHDVFLVVARRLDSFEGRSSLRTWIYGVALRVASDYRQRAAHRRELLGADIPERTEDATQERSLDDERLRDRLAELLERLPEEQRDVFVLYEIEELSMKEISEAAECPLQTAYSRLHAARKALREALSSEGRGS